MFSPPFGRPAQPWAALLFWSEMRTLPHRLHNVKWRRRVAVAGSIALVTALGTSFAAQLILLEVPMPLVLTAGTSLGAVVLAALLPHAREMGYESYRYRCPEPGCRVRGSEQVPAGQLSDPDFRSRVTEHARHAPISS